MDLLPRTKSAAQLRVGFMSQVSPDGRYVVTTIKPPGTEGSQFYYVANFKDYRFLQVFYPTRGILVWYDRDARKLQPLPGADDPRYVQTNAVWSPDGKYLVFARAEAKEPYPADGKWPPTPTTRRSARSSTTSTAFPSTTARAAQAEPIAGASRNGMSNSFPKISPDGRWIVFVQARNGQFMRPDSQLYIVPAAGGAGAPHALQHAADELLAQLLAQRPLAGVLLQEPLALHADVPHAHRRGGQRHAGHSDRELHRRQSRRQHSRVCEHHRRRHRAHRTFLRRISTASSMSRRP